MRGLKFFYGLKQTFTSQDLDFQKSRCRLKGRLVCTQNYHLNINSKYCALCAAAIMLLVVSTCLLLVAQLATPSGEPLLRLPLQATPSGELLRSARSAASELASSSSEAASDWSHCPSACKCKWASGKRTADCESGGLESLPLFPRYGKKMS